MAGAVRWSGYKFTLSDGTKFFARQTGTQTYYDEYNHNSSSEEVHQFTGPVFGELYRVDKVSESSSNEKLTLLNENELSFEYDRSFCSILLISRKFEISDYFLKKN